MTKIDGWDRPEPPGAGLKRVVRLEGARNPPPRPDSIELGRHAHGRQDETRGDETEVINLCQISVADAKALLDSEVWLGWGSAYLPPMPTDLQTLQRLLRQVVAKKATPEELALLESTKLFLDSAEKEMHTNGLDEHARRINAFSQQVQEISAQPSKGLIK